jgi:diacylglycerol kinase (ATP)
VSTSPTHSTPSPTASGIHRLRRAWANSLRGLAMAFRGEQAFRQEVALAVVLIPLSFWLGNSWVEISLLAGSVWLVMVVELLNSAVEAAIDRIGPERHPLSGRAKDIGSAAVWMALAMCAGIWGAALWARLAA